MPQRDLSGGSVVSSGDPAPRWPVLRASLQPLGALVGAVFGFGVLVVATRDGQFASIASFGAGAGVAALASVVAGGGTTLRYTTGERVRQSAVRKVRAKIVLPVVAIATLVAVLIYSGPGNLVPAAVAAGGLSTAAGVGAELDAAFLRRRLWTGRLFLGDTVHRGLAFTLVLVGSDFAYAMLLGSVVRALLLRIFAAEDPSRSAGLWLTRTELRHAYETRLTSLSILYSLCDRVGVLASAWVAPVPVAGGFVATVNAQQSWAGVLMTGVQTTLAARSEQRSALRWARWMDLMMVATGAVVAAVMIAWREPLLDFLGLDETTQPEKYWTAVVLLIPAALGSRVLEFHFLSVRNPANAVFVRGIATIVAVASASAAVVRTDISVLANGLLVGECASIVIALVLISFRQPQSRHGLGHA